MPSATHRLLGLGCRFLAGSSGHVAYDEQHLLPVAGVVNIPYDFHDLNFSTDATLHYDFSPLPLDLTLMHV